MEWDKCNDDRNLIEIVDGITLLELSGGGFACNIITVLFALILAANAPNLSLSVKCTAWTTKTIQL